MEKNHFEEKHVPYITIHLLLSKCLILDFRHTITHKKHILTFAKWISSYNKWENITEILQQYCCETAQLICDMNICN